MPRRRAPWCTPPMPAIASPANSARRSIPTRCPIAASWFSFLDGGAAMTEAAPNPAMTPRRRERRVPQVGVRQLPFARVYNRYKPIEVLSADHIEAIHRAALKLLRETGIEVM